MGKWLLIIFILFFSQNIYGQDDVSKYPVVDNVKLQEMEEPNNPVEIKLGKVRQLSIASYVEFTLKNNSNENLKTVRLIFYIFDNNDKCKKFDYYSSELLNLNPNENKSITAFVDQEIKSNDRLIVVVEKVKTDKGEWLMKEFGAQDDDFIKVYDKNFTEKLELSKIITYYTHTALIREDNIVLSEEDRKEIYQIGIKECLEDDNIKKLFRPTIHNPIILFSNEPIVEVPNLPQYKFINLTAKQIQTKANHLGLIKYLHIKELYIEGNSCSISLNYETAKKGYDFHGTCCCYSISYYLKKEQGKWVIKGGIGGYL